MKLKPLVIMMAMLPVGLLPTSTAIFASDLTLYKGNTTGKTSILLMLDTSGSMGISSLVMPKTNTYGSPGDVDVALCDRVDVPEFYSNGTSTANFKEWAYNLKDPTTKKTAIKRTITIGTTSITYYVRGCTSSGVTQYDRLSRLKDAILPLLAEDPSTGLSNSIIMGLGQFSSKTDLTIGNVTTRLVDGHSGRIVVPNAALSNAQRIKIAQALASVKSIDAVSDEDGTANSNLKLSSKTYPNIIKAASGTPTAHAYAEAAAYMMGTNTGGAATTSTTMNYIYDGYMLKQKGSEQVYLLCATSGGGTTSTLGATVKQCPSDWPEWDNTNKTVTGTQVLKPYNGSCTQESGANAGWCKVSYNGFKTAVGGGMVSLWDAYKKLPVGWRFDGWVKVPSEPLDIEPVVGTVWGYPDSINGLVSYRTNPFSLNGVDDNLVGGFAYSTADSKSGANYIAGGSTNTCDGNGIYFLTDGAPNSTKDTMARTIMNLSLSNSASYKFNAKPTGTGVLVSPALTSDLFAGETGGWEYIGEYAKKIRNRTTTSNTQKNPKDMNIKTAVVGFGASFAGLAKNADGTYNCSSAPNDDARNACLWGGKDYGDGGFYYAENADDIKSSIINFVNNVKVRFSPSSLGSISVPRDPLDQTQMMSTGFFPMILPQEVTDVMTWAGNLKKYKVLGGTLKDSSNNAIYTTTNNQQTINSSAKDLWSIAGANVDHSLVNSGGAWNKVPVPSSLNITDEPSKSDSVRNVFTMDGTVFKRITKENLATDYSGTAPAALSNTTNVTVAQRYNLLNYLGYMVTAASTLTATEVNTLAVAPASPYRYLGGVVHSTPLVVTASATLNASGNAIGSRKEYVVYGSMEGGLHVVDASNGEEQSVFVPKEVLDNQSGKTLANSDFTTTGTMSYGVDAPWAADNTFKVKTTTSGTTSTTRYEAAKMNIYGGLRMGGTGLYGLNIKTPTSPSLLFQITPSTTGFSRMGQIWSKPTLADIRVKGVRKRVLIFGGGYDKAVYERDQASFTEPTTATLGNAIYVVDANDGTLLWMASSDTTGVDSHKEITSAEMLYSVTGQPVVRDYDADGLADMIYFGDLGGQMFRVDLNNAAQTSTTANVNVGVRVKRIANLRETGFVPRFYERLT
ncbi:MAG: PilC/PilY family type IV pilus protein, partial [Acinetobacter sp.]